MGGGSWSASTYNNVTGANVRSGKTFGYSNATRNQSHDKWKAHEDLDPLSKCGPASPFAGQNVRESRDNAEHPNSTPIAIFFDVTGSMGEVPRTLQRQLAKVFNMLIDGGLCDDPQVMIGAYGDAEYDRVPLQASQFESDNRIDDNLNNVFVEGGGAGNGHEHSALAWYYVGTHTDTDSWNKRGKRGYLFTIGDEITGTVPRRAIKGTTGDDVESDISPKRALALANEQWNVFHIVIDNWTAQRQQSVKFYSNILGGNCITVESIDQVAETIALVIGFFEGRLNPNVVADSNVVHKVEVLGTSKRPAITAL